MASFTETYAIAVSPAERGWTWRLIDADGDVSAAGVANDQMAAMGTAWRLARSMTQSRGRTSKSNHPQVLVG